MPTRRRLIARATLIAAFAPLGLIPLCAALAGEIVPFEAEDFAAAQRAGAPIVVAVGAPWCPICKAQKPILARLAAEPRFRELRVFTIDFDTQKDLLRRFDARMQSTLIAFRGAAETGRSVGETQAEWIEGLVEKTL